MRPLNTLNSVYNNQIIVWDNEVYLLITQTSSYGRIANDVLYFVLGRTDLCTLEMFQFTCGCQWYSQIFSTAHG